VLVVVIFAVVSGILLAHQAGTAYVLLIKKIILEDSLVNMQLNGY